MAHKHSYPYDPSYGMTEKDLLAVQTPPPPEGFEAFWRTLYKETMAEKLDYHVEEELWSPEKDTRIFRIRFTHDNGISIGMWLTRPAESRGGILVGHGYGHITTAEDALRRSFTTIHPCIRGLGLSQQKDIPWQVEHHSVYGAESARTYVLAGAVKDLWMSVRVLEDLYPDAMENLHYEGISLGGGLGMLLLPWDDRIGASCIYIPALAGPFQFDFATMDHTANYARKNLAEKDPGFRKVFSFFDASAAARFMRKKILITPALFDPVNPPPVQFAIANSIPEEYRIMKIRETGHFPPTEKDLQVEKEAEQIRDELFARM